LRTIQFGPCWVVTSSPPPPWCFEAQWCPIIFTVLLTRHRHQQSSSSTPKMEGGKTGGNIYIFHMAKMQCGNAREGQKYYYYYYFKGGGKMALKRE
jgi:hypothetical protein